jgi:hypothetical protein
LRYSCQNVSARLLYFWELSIVQCQNGEEQKKGLLYTKPITHCEHLWYNKLNPKTSSCSMLMQWMELESFWFSHLVILLVARDFDINVFYFWGSLSIAMGKIHFWTKVQLPLKALPPFKKGREDIAWNKKALYFILQVLLILDFVDVLSNNNYGHW